MRQERKKERKEKKRKQQDARRKAYEDRVARERARRARYPAIAFDTTYGTPAFVDAVRQVVDQIDFEDEECFCKGEQYLYRLMAQHGAAHAIDILRAKMREGEGEWEIDGEGLAQLGEYSFRAGIGEKIFERMPEAQRRQFLPYNSLRALFHDKRIVLHFSSLLSQPGPNGTVYFSRKRPEVEFGGQRKVVSFSRHAIERICERLAPDWLTYPSLAQVHAYFASCVNFEPLVLPGGQTTITFFQACDLMVSGLYETYVRQILGEENRDRSQGEVYYRVGYCPVVIEGEFAKAKTFLYPGYKATPEYNLLRNARLPPEEKALLEELVRTQDPARVPAGDEARAIKWFHQNGIPQVIQTKRPMFQYEEGP